jgi:hypothetical protein
MSTPKPIPPPLSPAVEAALYVSGALCLLGMLLSIWGRFALSAGDAVLGHRSGLSLGPLYCQALIGLGLLVMPSQQRRLREERLRAHRAAAGGDAPAPELPRTPDSVLLGALFGLLSLLSLPFLFGPAAVVSGTVALTRGRLTGLIGLALGLAGLAGFAYLLSHLMRA